MEFTKFIVSAVDYNDGCDGKARILFNSDNIEEAKAYVENDMKDYIDRNTSNDGDCQFIADFDKMSIFNKIITLPYGCEWNIEKITINISQKELDEVFFDKSVSK